MLPIIKVVIIAVLVAGATTGIIVGIIIGTTPTVSDDEYQIIKPPSDIKIELRENYIDIRWSPSKSDYDLHYKVTVQIGEDDPIQEETNETFITIPITLIYCSMIEVTVMAVGEKTKSDIVTKSRPTTPTQEDINAVIISYDSFNPTTRELRWSVDRLFIGCDTEYQLTINDYEPFKTEGTIYQLPEGKMNPVCQDNDVKIKVIVDGVSGEEHEIDQKIIVAPSETEVKAVDVTFGDFDPVSKLLSWAIIDNPFPECTVTYIINVNTYEDETNYNSFTIPNELLNSACESNVVKIRPKIQSVAGREQQYDGRIVVDPTEEDVQEATVTFDDFNSETRILSWNLNRPFAECIVTYDVTVNNLPPTRVETNSFNLNTVQLNPACENNVVRVRPEIQSIQGREQRYDGIIAVDPTVEEVQDAIVTFDNFNSQTRMLSWNLNRLFTECIVTYDVTVNNLPPTRVETNSFNLHTVQLNPACENNEVRVRPEIQSIQGRDQRYDGIIAVDPTVEEVQDVIVTFDNFNSQTRMLSWNLNRPFTGCVVTYDVIVNMLPPTRVETNSFNLHTVQLHPACENNEVRVRPEIQSIQGREQRYDGIIAVDPTVEEVQDVIVTFDNFNSQTRMLSWNLNRPFTGCIVTYDVIVNMLPPTRVETNSFNLHTVQLNPACENNEVRVRPEIQSIQGREQRYDGIIAVDPTVEEVQDVIVTFDNFNSQTRMLSWNLNRPFTGCIVTYDVTVNSLPPTRVETNSFNLHTVQLNPACENNVVRVRPEIQSIQGREQRYDGRIAVDPTVEEVQDAIVTFDTFNLESRMLSWNLNRPFTGCIVTYDVTVNMLPSTRVETNSFNLHTVQLNPACENNEVRVRPEIQSIQGRDQRYYGRIAVDPTVEEVQNAIVTFDTFNLETRMLSWNLNRPFTGCIVTYDVTVNSLPPTRVETNSFNLHTVQLNPACENNEVRVRPEIQSIQGSDQRYGGIITVEPSFIPVVQNALTEFWERDVRISWEPPLGLGACELIYDVHLWGNNGDMPLSYGLGLVEREFRFRIILTADDCDTIQVTIVSRFRDLIGDSPNHIECQTTPIYPNI